MIDQEKVALATVTEGHRALLTPIVGGIAAGTVALGLPAVVDKVRDVRVRRNRDKYIKAMKEVHPDLRDVSKKDLYVAYNSLAMHTPHVLKDPLLGGQELRRMAKYRQADLNSLNEMNKLRGSSMMDQAFLNATNYVSGGIAEGFKGYQAQRVADQDQRYRERMDQYRMDMDAAKFELDKERMRVQGQQFGETYGQRERQFAAGQAQSAAQQAQNLQVRATEFGYRQDEDARSEARWQVEQATREMANDLKQVDLAQRGVTQVRARDDQGAPMRDGNGDPVYINQPGVSVQSIVNKMQYATRPTPVAKRNAGQDRSKRSMPTKPNSRPYQAVDSTVPLFDPNSIKAPTVKTSSVADLGDIVARLRDRNL